MVNVSYPKGQWEVLCKFKNNECPYLYYPANYHGCELMEVDNNECTKDGCPKKHTHKGERG